MSVRNLPRKDYLTMNREEDRLAYQSELIEARILERQHELGGC